ncbi:hypothetical protein PV08_00843 [Exophiala spinifera]|uniref:Glucose-methanol-choline oxidoreductase N-terminal domain-containing protein n=1 Tax=Exophiala spinifera TaxID=91928 RepID=A0A0D2BMU5_9EURO|nr:uncharacterized protein PV08_00843 [Exophiala spinifera]KIW20268.1 hypothetical protein PV08_00843 [Exophiala spinifera]
MDGGKGSKESQRSAHVTVDEFVQREYDYIICGGGTAGLTIAARLSENPNVTVGVIEAGSNHLGNPLVDTPAALLQMLNDPEYDWSFRTTPQKGNKSKVHHVPRGKLLGGSSGINYMMYVRGSDEDYDNWARLADDPSWSSSNMKHYMRKHQTLEPVDERITDRTCMPVVAENHGTSGPIHTSFNDFRLPIEDDVIKAAEQALGSSIKPTDPWSGNHMGFYNTLGSVTRTGPNKGKRSYAAEGYFQANAHRPNLKLITESLVCRVLLDNTNTVARGVEFQHRDGARHTVVATREVIVAGGVINSPQILELSGIGDPEILGAAGVQCLVPLPPVGTNYQDHVGSAVTYQLTPGNMSGDAMFIPEVMAAAQKQLIEEQGGPLTAVQSVQGYLAASTVLEAGELNEVVRSIETTKPATAFQKKQWAQVAAHIKDASSANLQLIFLNATVNLADGAGDQSKLMAPPSEPSAPNGMSLGISLQYPVSRGHVHIKSSDPHDHPDINPNYLAHPADVAVLAAGLKFVEKMARSPALQGKVGPRVGPPPRVVPALDTKDRRRAAVREYCMGEYHSCGTCAMGDTVDSRLRVRGVRNLRVADASVFANNVSGNICATVYAVAEKAADMIKEDWDRVASSPTITARARL